MIIAVLTWTPAVLCTGGPASSHEGTVGFRAANRIDELQLANLKKVAVEPAMICPDHVFLRRAHLDLTGTVPTLEEARAFLADESKDKRAKLIESLLSRQEFAAYWTLRWGDILRIKSEFPVNLWPNSVQAYSQWIADSILKNKPYDQFARELIGATGSNFRDPPSNFYRSARERTPAGFAAIAALAFLGSRVEDWDAARQKEFQKLFSKIHLKKTSEWKEEILCVNQEPFEAFTAIMPDGSKISIESGTDPREALASWLTGPGKRLFARAAVNRVWFWLFGRGIIHEADRIPLGGAADPSGAGAPSNPELLDWLADEFIRTGYDFKSLLRLIANSSTYQQSCVSRGSNPERAAKYFAVYMPRRIDAEVLADALSYLAGNRPKYMSVIPEPFTYVPREFPTIALNDGSITSAFLETFGRPARDTGILSERSSDCTYAQRLFLLNSTEIQNKVCNTKHLQEILKEHKKDPGHVRNCIYLLVLSRYPSQEEMTLIKENFKDSASDRKGKRLQTVSAPVRQLVWALVNSREFLYKH
jgi:hypothetical protein